MRYSKVLSILILLSFTLQSNKTNTTKQGITNLIFSEFFSPNGDGNNDFFIIKNLENYPINKIHIFNRWGDKVFEAEPYKNDWDGMSNAKNQFFGKRVPEGTYFFRFEYLIGDFIQPYNGKVILMR
jgi:gliding motility-associated-like protein